jgi:hypothetical protein
MDIFEAVKSRKLEEKIEHYVTEVSCPAEYLLGL